MNIHSEVDMSASPFARVLDFCAAIQRGALTESELVERLVAVPPVEQANLPDDPWADGMIRNQGPIAGLEEAFRRRLISDDVYAVAVGSMLDAGHEA